MSSNPRCAKGGASSLEDGCLRWSGYETAAAREKTPTVGKTVKQGNAVAKLAPQRRKADGSDTRRVAICEGPFLGGGVYPLWVALEVRC